LLCPFGANCASSNRARSVEREGTARYSGASSPAHRAQTHMLVRRRDTGTSIAQAAPQSRSVRMIASTRLSRAGRARIASRGLAGLVLVDLPIDVVVVLEQQERAGQSQRPDQAPREQRHVS
jgi:hypothetical protein